MVMLVTGVTGGVMVVFGHVVGDMLMLVTGGVMVVYGDFVMVVTDVNGMQCDVWWCLADRRHVYACVG
jgi:hypothetical protein